MLVLGIGLAGFYGDLFGGTNEKIAVETREDGSPTPNRPKGSGFALCFGENRLTDPPRTFSDGRGLRIGPETRIRPVSHDLAAVGVPEFETLFFGLKDKILYPLISNGFISREPLLVAQYYKFNVPFALYFRILLTR